MPDRKPRVVLLTSGGPLSRMTFHALKEDVDFVAAVVESRPAARAILRRRVRRLGAATVAGQLAFQGVGRWAERASRARNAEIRHRHGLDDSPLPPALVRCVSSANSEEARDALKRHAPDVVLVAGTRILSRRLIDSVAAPILNTHLGVTPRYRGVHGGYWALAEGDPEHFGVTVHLVDAGIDTGGVLGQATAEPTTHDGFYTYPTLQLAAAIPLLRRALADAAAGRLSPQRGVGPSRLWSHPTLWGYLWRRLTRGVK